MADVRDAGPRGVCRRRDCEGTNPMAWPWYRVLAWCLELGEDRAMKMSGDRKTSVCGDGSCGIGNVLY